MSRNRVGVEEPGCRTRIVPPCSTMKSRFEASPALATKTGLDSPVETTGWSWMAPTSEGEKASKTTIKQASRRFIVLLLSQWNVARGFYRRNWEAGRCSVGGYHPSSRVSRWLCFAKKTPLAE